MKRLLQWLFVGHVHKWKNLSQHNVTNGNGGYSGVAFVQQCEQCGKVQRVDL